ncbi:MAG: stage II sporulation protein P [Desulfitobacteriaceae bacterium]
MLQDQAAYQKHSIFWPSAQLAQGFIMMLAIILFFSGVFYAVNNGSSGQLARLIIDQGVPIEAFLLEGAAGYSQPERLRLDKLRNQGVSLSMFLLTGVNLADSRTFFLSYFSPPPQGPAWLGWAYYPNDPELEGPIPQAIPDSSSGDPEVNLPTTPVPTQAIPGLNGKKVLVGIYHTHNAESYAGDGGPERREGENGDVVTIGETLTKSLAKQGIGVSHSLQIHDAVDFMKAYGNSIITAQKLLQDNPSLRLLLDVHRDGLPAGVNKSIALVNGKQRSKVLIVIGKKNPHWQKNEELAKQIMALGEKKYPDLFAKEISYAADARYNQHLADGALLFEFGSQLNTLAEANGAAEAVAEILGDWLKKE